MRLASCAFGVLIVCACCVSAAEPDHFAGIGEAYAADVRPLVEQFCLDCHSTAAQEGELDLERFAALADVRRDAQVWLKVADMLDSGEMPPKDAAQPSADQRKALRGWVAKYLHAEALATAGDPGPVVLRRLNNAQYTYTIRDLTGVDLDPVREFPADGAAGEGFTNAGNALAMSPSLLSKYLGAAKEIAGHAVLLPDGFRFSPAATRRDWTNEIVDRIRRFYLAYTDPTGGTAVNLQGLTWETNKGGRLPLEGYLKTLLSHRDAIAAGTKSLAALAADNKLNARYLSSLWQVLNAAEPSPLFEELRVRWRAAGPDGAAPLVEYVTRWQEALTRFQAVGHMKPWMVPVNPLAARQEFRLAIPAPAEGNAVTVYLAAGNAGDGAAGDVVVWQNPRLVTPGRPDLALRDVRTVVGALAAKRAQIFAATSQALAAAEEASRASEPVDVAALAARHGVATDALAAWLDYLGIQSGDELKLDHLTARIDQSAGYAFAKGFGSGETPNVVANASDQHVRIPGNLKPHGVVMHPSPTLAVAAGWRSPIGGAVRISGQVTHAHPECGNGVAWSLELRRGRTRQTLAAGVAHGGTPSQLPALEPLPVRPGDLVSLVIGPRDGNHACDLTDVELNLTSTADDARAWSLTRDVAPDIHAGNPHADTHGNAGVWHFYTEPIKSGTGPAVIPAGSLLARWQAAAAGDKPQLAAEVQRLLTSGPPADAAHPDAVLYRQLASLGGPLFAAARAQAPSNASPAAGDAQAWGLDPTVFGRHPDGSPADGNDLVVQAPAVVEIRLPADLVAGAELVATAALDARAGAEGSAQLSAGITRPAALPELRADAPVVVAENSRARQRFERSFDEFRQWFPRALRYLQIVPVDEVITLTLFHREDEHLCRLMLDDAARAQLDRLWQELHFVSQDALTVVDAFFQLLEYASQDSDPKLFEPFRKPIHDRAAAFKQELVDAEPRQLDALVAFAAQAFRRPLAEREAAELRALYQKLRADELAHDEAFRLTLARVFVSPEFLYRLETAAPGDKPGRVSDFELATRLSYFLWSSAPDAALGEAAAAGTLSNPNVLVAHARRMLADDRIRRLATEFACQWLHVYEFDTLDEKSEAHFPEFAELRGPMYEEAIRFFTDLFQRDASVLDVLAADHSFVNEPLAKFYGIAAAGGPEWRRVESWGARGRGGILGLAAVLAKQSGASRTSPTLRGNWVSEVLLGEKLPKPPKDVPQLPDDETAIGELTVRQIVERHARDANCAKCHVKVDPIGFALESFDAIGRGRERDLANRPIDTRTRLADGTELDGLSGLRDYLLTARRDDVLRQFCRKLLGYALGRGVQLSDEPLLAAMREQLERNEFRFSAAVETIVRSPQFREIRGADAQFAEAP